MSGTTRHLYGSTFFLHFKLVTCVLTLPLQTASGRHWLATCALHLLTGAAVESANPWRRSNLFMKNAAKEMNLSGVLSFKIRWSYSIMIPEKAGCRVEMWKAVPIDTVQFTKFRTYTFFNF